MDRPKFPNGVVVTQAQLGYMADAVTAGIARRWVGLSQAGVISGLEVTVAAGSPTLVNVAAGDGQAEGGELVSLAAGALSLALADYTVGMRNFICLVYTEVDSRPEAHASSGRTAATRTTGSSRVRVYSEPNYLALAATSSDLTVDARDRIFVPAVVTARGAGVPLTAADILSPVSVLTMSLGMDQPTNITGVVITAVSSDTTPSAGLTTNPLARLTYVSGAFPSTDATLSYRAPGDSAAGSAVNITAGEASYPAFTLASSGGETVTVEVVADLLLPVPSVTTTDDLEVYNMYQLEAQRASASDAVHRSQMGTMVPSRGNPHGQRVRDLGDQILEARQGIVLGTGLADIDDGDLVPRIVAAQTGTTRTFLADHPLSAITTSLRTYLTDDGDMEFVYGARWNGTGWDLDNSGGPTPVSRVSVGADGLSLSGYTSATTPFLDSAWTTTNLTATTTAGSGNQGLITMLTTLAMGAAAGGITQLVERLRINYLVTTRTLLFASDLFGSSGHAGNMRVYRAPTTVLGSGFDALEVTFNAVWDGSAWTSDSAASYSLKLQLSRDGLFVAARAPAAGTWTDGFVIGGWVTSGIGFSSATGVLYAQNFAYNPAITFSRVFSAAEAIVDGAGATINGMLPTLPESYSLTVVYTGSSSAAFSLNGLPNGALITGITAYFESATVGGGDALTVAGMRQAISGATVAQSFTTGAGYAAAATSAIPFTVAVVLNEGAAVYTIDKSAYTYWVQVAALDGGTVAGILRSVVVTYSMTSIAF